MQEEQLYGVSLGAGRGIYGGRDQHGAIRKTVIGQGTLMNGETAEKLRAILSYEHPFANVIPLQRGDRDEMAATSLAELGEAVGLDKLEVVLQQCILQGFDAEEILLKCRNTIDSATQQVAKQQRIHELEAETRRLKLS